MQISSLKVISIVSTPPHQYSQHLDKISPPGFFLKAWTNHNGETFGIPSRSHFLKLAKAITKIADDINYEIWQPDTRADKIYDYALTGNIHYKIFPTVTKNKLYGCRIIKKIYPLGLIEELIRLNDSQDAKNIVIRLDMVFDGYVKDIIRQITRIPVVFMFHNEINLPSTRFLSLNRNIFSKINLITEHLWLKKNINKVACITYQNNKNLNALRNIYKGRLEKIPTFCNFSFWRKQSKEQARKDLNLPQDAFILFSACRLNPIKQIDRFINVLDILSNKFNFLYLIAGCATDAKYDFYLRKLAYTLHNQRKIEFLGLLLEEEKLLKYYNAADLYVSVSSAEGCPVAVVQAFACEVPVFSTKAGNTAELMEEENAGTLVETKNYKQWLRELEEILREKQPPRVVNREIAKERYDEVNVADKLIKLYKSLI